MAKRNPTNPIIPKKTEAARTLPPILASFLDRLETEPRSGRLGLLAIMLAVGLYTAGLGYPLVFGDFAVLAPDRLAAYTQSAPALASSWLPGASFGWSSKLFGTAWAWHRAVNLTLHALSVWFAFALFRRLCVSADQPRAGALASGWIAFFAASLFALHPVAVYDVAYLAERASLFAGMFALIALWSTARGAQDGWRGAWVVGPLAAAGALMCTPSAIGVPVAMALVAFVLRPQAGPARGSAWGGIGLAAVFAIAYALAFAGIAAVAVDTAARADYLDALAATSSRFLRYLGLWLIPVTAWMAIEVPDPLMSSGASWRGALSIALVAALAVAAAFLLARRGSLRCAGFGLACALALYSAEWLWPRVGAPFALSRSYAWMPCICLALACLLRYVPAKAAFAAGCALLILWAVLAASTLQTFSTHVTLWDDAVRRAERAGPMPADARIYLNRAAVHRRDGHLIAALEDYGKALALQPDHPRALRGRAQVYIDDKRYDAALRDLDRLLELDPSQAITHADRGLALMQMGRLADAGNAFDRAIEQGVKEARVFLNRGLARLMISGLEAAPMALTDIETALTLDPRYALAFFNRGLVFEEAAKAGMRLRDAASPELMRAVAQENITRACQLGHAPACARGRDKSAQDAPPGAKEGPLRVTPETLRSQGLPPVR